MNNFKSRINALTWGALCLLAAGSAARADDTEIFFGTTIVNVPANIMLIMDTSGSMAAEVSSQEPYDPTHIYGGSCSDSYYYHVASPGGGTTVTPPSCSDTSAQITKSQFRCTAADAALGSGTGAAGYYADDLIRWGNYTQSTSTVTTGGTLAACQAAAAAAGGNYTYAPATRRRASRCVVTTTNSTHTWQSSLTVANGTDVECAADRPGVGSDTTYPTRNSDAASTTGVYTPTLADSWWGVFGNAGGPNYIYSANYLNYYFNADTSIQTRMSTVKAAASGLVTSMSGVNVGLMTYSYSGSGGMVRSPVQSIDATGVRDSLVSEINEMVPAGDTPLSETLFEAYRYYSGGPVLFGGTGSPFASSRCTSGSSSYPDWFGNYVGSCDDSESYPSVASSQSPAGTYDSPADYSCHKNYVVYLTDGEPTNDNEADPYMEGRAATRWSPAVTGIPNFASVTGGCSGSGDGRCLTALSKYMHDSICARMSMTSRTSRATSSASAANLRERQIRRSSSCRTRPRRAAARPTRPPTMPV